MKKLLAWWAKQPVLVVLMVYGTLGLGICLAAISTCRAAAPTATLSASPTSGSAPLPVTLTWSSSGADNCTASGGWQGAKALAGTETVSVTANTTFTLTCATATGSATLTWTPPTQDVTGALLPATGPDSLAGFKIYHSTTATGVAQATPIVLDGKTLTTYTITGLPTGIRYYGMKAFTTALVESDMTGTVNNTIVLPSGSASASVTVNVKPKPPVIVTVSQVVYELKSSPNGNMLGRNIGTIQLGTPCGEAPLVQSYGASYYQVPLNLVEVQKPPKGSTVVAACALVDG